MIHEVHTIRRAIVIPLGMAVLSLAVLLVFSWTAGSFPGERLVLGIVFIVLCYCYLEIIARRVSFTDDGLTIEKLLRKKKLSWDDVTHVGSVVIGEKIYVLLTTTRGFYILSNNYERFSDMLDSMNRRLSSERMDSEVRGFIVSPRKNNKPVRSAWFLAVFMVAMIMVRLFIL